MAKTRGGISGEIYFIPTDALSNEAMEEGCAWFNHKHLADYFYGNGGGR